jgi:hypothetical protein
MMSDKRFDSLDQIRLEARLMAIENIFAGLFADTNRRHGVTFHQFSATAEEMHQQLRQQLTGQGADSPISGIIAAEIEQAILALTRKIADYIQIASHRDTRWNIPASNKGYRALRLRFAFATVCDALLRRLAEAERRFRAQRSLSVKT